MSRRGREEYPDLKRVFDEKRPVVQNLRPRLDPIEGPHRVPITGKRVFAV